jgi:hypothetical protein
MVDLPSPFGGGPDFDASDEFVPAHLPEPGPFLADHDVLTGTAHVRFHERTHEIFEARSVYDVTFDYNLARLNRDPRHPDAGFRYAEDRDDAEVLRAEFTPTTEFCPQGETLAVAACRAWNGLSERHDYETVRVRVHPMHQHAETINERLTALDPAGRPADTATTAGANEPQTPTSPF